MFRIKMYSLSEKNLFVEKLWFIVNSLLHALMMDTFKLLLKAPSLSNIFKVVALLKNRIVKDILAKQIFKKSFIGQENYFLTRIICKTKYKCKWISLITIIAIKNIKSLLQNRKASRYRQIEKIIWKDNQI